MPPADLPYILERIAYETGPKLAVNATRSIPSPCNTTGNGSLQLARPYTLSESDFDALVKELNTQMDEANLRIRFAPVRGATPRPPGLAEDAKYYLTGDINALTQIEEVINTFAGIKLSAVSDKFNTTQRRAAGEVLYACLVQNFKDERLDPHFQYDGLEDKYVLQASSGGEYGGNFIKPYTFTDDAFAALNDLLKKHDINIQLQHGEVRVRQPDASERIVPIVYIPGSVAPAEIEKLKRLTGYSERSEGRPTLVPGDARFLGALNSIKSTDGLVDQKPYPCHYQLPPAPPPRRAEPLTVDPVEVPPTPHDPLAQHEALVRQRTELERQKSAADKWLETAMDAHTTEALKALGVTQAMQRQGITTPQAPNLMKRVNDILSSTGEEPPVGASWQRADGEARKNALNVLGLNNLIDDSSILVERSEGYIPGNQNLFSATYAAVKDGKVIGAGTMSETRDKGRITSMILVGKDNKGRITAMKIEDGKTTSLEIHRHAEGMTITTTDRTKSTVKEIDQAALLQTAMEKIPDQKEAIQQYQPNSEGLKKLREQIAALEKTEAYKTAKAAAQAREPKRPELLKVAPVEVPPRRAEPLKVAPVEVTKGSTAEKTVTPPTGNGTRGANPTPSDREILASYDTAVKELEQLQARQDSQQQWLNKTLVTAKQHATKSILLNISGQGLTENMSYNPLPHTLAERVEALSNRMPDATVLNMGIGAQKSEAEKVLHTLGIKHAAHIQVLKKAVDGGIAYQIIDTQGTPKILAAMATGEKTLPDGKKTPLSVHYHFEHERLTVMEQGAGTATIHTLRRRGEGIDVYRQQSAVTSNGLASGQDTQQKNLSYDLAGLFDLVDTNDSQAARSYLSDRAALEAVKKKIVDLKNTHESVFARDKARKNAESILKQEQGAAIEVKKSLNAFAEAHTLLGTGDKALETYSEFNALSRDTIAARNMRKVEDAEEIEKIRDLIPHSWNRELYKAEYTETRTIGGKNYTVTGTHYLLGHPPADNKKPFAVLTTETIMDGKAPAATIDRRTYTQGTYDSHTQTTVQYADDRKATHEVWQRYNRGSVYLTLKVATYDVDGKKHEQAPQIFNSDALLKTAEKPGEEKPASQKAQEEATKKKATEDAKRAEEARKEAREKARKPATDQPAPTRPTTGTPPGTPPGTTPVTGSTGGAPETTATTTPPPPTTSGIGGAIAALALGSAAYFLSSGLGVMGAAVVALATAVGGWFLGGYIEEQVNKPATPGTGTHDNSKEKKTALPLRREGEALGANTPAPDALNPAKARELIGNGDFPTFTIANVPVAPDQFPGFTGPGAPQAPRQGV